MFRPSSFFNAAPRGRRIVAGFSYVQRIGKRAATHAWFPDSFDNDTPIDWAAVREFDLVQESGNIVIDKLEVANIQRAMKILLRMRGGGTRLTMVTLGRYAEPGEVDDLQILDQKLQEEITRMIHFLYLGERSEYESHARARMLDEGLWSCADALPHVMQAVGERRLFKPHKETFEEKVFFDLLGILPARHVAHDVAVGLALPDATKDHEEPYITLPEHKITSFMNAIGTTMGTFIVHHARGHGDRLTPEASAWQRRCVAALNVA